MATFVNDTFTQAASANLELHTGETGATWTKHTSYASATVVVDGALDVVRRSDTAADAGIFYASGSPLAAEYDVQATILASANPADGDKAQIAGRVATGADTMYRAGATFVGVGRTTLDKVVSGAVTNLATSGFFDGSVPGASTSAVYKLEIRDATKRFYVGGVLWLSSTDNAITAAGKAGLGVTTVVAGATNGLQIDNFTALDPAAVAASDPAFRRRPSHGLLMRRKGR